MFAASLLRARRWRVLAYGSRCAAAEHQSQIDQFTFPPAPQSQPNSFPKPNIRNKPVVQFAPAAISFAVVAGRPTPLRQSDKAPVIKTHHAPGHFPAEAAERQIKEFATLDRDKPPRPSRYNSCSHPVEAQPTSDRRLPCSSICPCTKFRTSNGR